jgi:hypothetical protein
MLYINLDRGKTPQFSELCYAKKPCDPGGQNKHRALFADFWTKRDHMLLDNDRVAISISRPGKSILM